MTEQEIADSLALIESKGYFLRDDTEIRRGVECFADQVEGYSLFRCEPLERIHVFGGRKEWAVKEALALIATEEKM